MMKRKWLSGILLGLLAVLVVSGCAADFTGGSAGGNAKEKPVSKPVEQTRPVSGDLVPVKIYFGTHDAKHIVAETHRLKKEPQIMQRAMEVMVEGPKRTDLVSVLPRATKVRSVVLKDKTAYVDFSAEIAKRGFGGSATEILAVGAIVNTLTEFPDVELVQILVEGKRVSTLFGHLDVYDPLSRSPGIIKNR